MNRAFIEIYEDDGAYGSIVFIDQIKLIHQTGLDGFAISLIGEDGWPVNKGSGYKDLVERLKWMMNNQR